MEKVRTKVIAAALVSLISGEASAVRSVLPENVEFPPSVLELIKSGDIAIVDGVLSLSPTAIEFFTGQKLGSHDEAYLEYLSDEMRLEYMKSIVGPDRFQQILGNVEGLKTMGFSGPNN